MSEAILTSLQEEAWQAIVILPEDRLPTLISFAKFLGSDESVHSEEHETDISMKRKSLYGILKGKIQIAEDFNDTPDCFQEYI